MYNNYYYLLLSYHLLRRMEDQALFKTRVRRVEEKEIKFVQSVGPQFELKQSVNRIAYAVYTLEGNLYHPVKNSWKQNVGGKYRLPRSILRENAAFSRWRVRKQRVPGNEGKAKCLKAL